MRSGNETTPYPGIRLGGGRRETGTHCSRMRQLPLVTCILLRYTKITVNFVYLLKGHSAGYTSTVPINLVKLSRDVVASYLTKAYSKIGEKAWYPLFAHLLN